ncbi:MAG: rod-binding protein [Spirochaetales bacterium]|nr:rod-binding protein [Spirochaetales bacterium]
MQGSNTYAKIQAKVDRKQDPKLYEVCVEFESIFIKQMLSTMKKTVHKNEMLHGGQAEEIFEDMLYDEYSKSMAKNANFGLADMVYRDLITRKTPESI